MDPVLTIAIPTYNRARHLRETLDQLVGQVEGLPAEIVVLDNCSPDHTPEIVARYGSRVRHVRHATNIGSDLNMIACLTAGSGKYVWILCDDDLPVSDAVASVLQAIEDHGNPPLLFATQDWRDVFCSGFDRQPVRTGWDDLDANGFLAKVSFYFSAASGIIVRKDAVDHPFIAAQIGTNLVPASITVRTADVHNRGLVARSPIAICRGGNSGGYDGLQVFVRNAEILLGRCNATGFRKEVVDAMMEENLSGVVMHVVRSMPLTWTGLFYLVKSSWRRRNFRAVVVPAILRRWIRPWRRASLRRRILARLHGRLVRSQESSNAAFGRNLSQAFPDLSVGEGWNVEGGKWIQAGSGFKAGRNLALVARRQDGLPAPCLLMGCDLRLGDGVRVESVRRVEIGDRVAIGDGAVIEDGWTPVGEGIVIHSDTVVGAGSRIDSGAWIGSGVRIAPGVRLGSNCVVQDGAQIDTDVPAGAFVAGTSAIRIPSQRAP